MAYTPTIWKNSDLPAISADNLNHIEQGTKDAHDSIDAINTNYSSYATASYVGAAVDGSDSAFNSFDTFENQGNLQPSSNGITIGDDISTVFVSATIGFQNATSSYNLVHGGISKNGTSIQSAYVELRNSNGSQGFVTLSAIIPVQEGDIISIYGNGDSTTSIRRAYLNVKAIGNLN